VFDLGSWADLDDLHGRFSPVLEVRGTITTGSSILPGADVDAAQTVAVRRDLLRHVEVDA
jgi:hypothetical protein